MILGIHAQKKDVTGVVIAREHQQWCPEDDRKDDSAFFRRFIPRYTLTIGNKVI